MTVWRDDLGEPVELPGPARRVVSLVPSLTEAVARSAPGLLVGATDWCTHPAGLVVTRVRGTKNPDRTKVTTLAPDLVIANREENRKLDVVRLRDAGLAVWVTVIESVPEALASLRRLLTGPLGLQVPDWLAAAEQAWAGRRPSPGPGAGSWCRSGVTRGWSSARARSPATCWCGSAWTTCSARARGATPAWRRRRSGPPRPMWCCCPTSLTRSPPPTGRRNSLPSASCLSRAGC